MSDCSQQKMSVGDDLTPANNKKGPHEERVTQEKKAQKKKSGCRPPSKNAEDEQVENEVEEAAEVENVENEVGEAAESHPVPHDLAAALKAAVSSAQHKANESDRAQLVEIGGGYFRYVQVDDLVYAKNPPNFDDDWVPMGVIEEWYPPVLRTADGVYYFDEDHKPACQCAVFRMNRVDPNLRATMLF